jgi:hypothetical protein
VIASTKEEVVYIGEDEGSCYNSLNEIKKKINSYFLYKP